MKKLFFIETETKHTKHENFDKVLKTQEYAVKEEEKLEEKLSPFMREPTSCMMYLNQLNSYIKLERGEKP